MKVEQAGKLASHFKVTAREPGSAKLTLTDTVIGNANIGVGAGNTTLTQGSAGTVHLKVSNAGPNAATDVKLKLSGGGDAKLQGAKSEQGKCTHSGGTIECDLGEIPANGQASVVASVFGTSVGSGHVTAQATTTATDKDNGNNVATATVTVKAQSSGNNSGGGGGGAFSWLALAALLGLVLSSAVFGMSRRRS